MTRSQPKIQPTSESEVTTWPVDTCLSGPANEQRKVITYGRKAVADPRPTSHVKEIAVGAALLVVVLLLLWVAGPLSNWLS